MPKKEVKLTALAIKQKALKKKALKLMDSEVKRIQLENRVMWLDALERAKGNQSILRLVPHTKQNLKDARKLVQSILNCESKDIHIRYRQGKRSLQSFTKDVMKDGSKAFDVYVKGRYQAPNDIDYQLMQVSDLHKRIRDLKDRCNELSDQVGPLQDEVSTLKGELERSQILRDQLQQEHNRVKAEQSDYQNDAILWQQNKDLLKMLLRHKSEELEYRS